MDSSAGIAGCGICHNSDVDSIAGCCRGLAHRCGLLHLSAAHIVVYIHVDTRAEAAHIHVHVDAAAHIIVGRCGRRGRCGVLHIIVLCKRLDSCRKAKERKNDFFHW